MKRYIVTEEQIKNVIDVLIAEQNWDYENTIEKILYSDNNISVVCENFNTKKNAVAVTDPGFGIPTFTLMVYNKNVKSNIIFTVLNVGSSYLKLPEERSFNIKPNQSVPYINIEIDDSKVGNFKLDLSFAYKFPGTKEIVKKIVIPFTRRTKTYDPNTECKQKFSYKVLKKATDWWRSWLNNNDTKYKFGKIFKYDRETVEEHFENYNKILNQIKLEYISDKKMPGAYVKPSYLQNKGITTGGYDIPLTINCAVIGDYFNPQSTMLHEIQHILDSYHKFHPYKDDRNIIDFYSELIKGITQVKPNNSNNYFNSVRKFLQNYGFTSDGISKIMIVYEDRVKNDVLHLTNPNEMTSTLFQVRMKLNLKPGQQITKQMLINNADKFVEVRDFICQWLYSKQSLDKYLGYQNTIAMRQGKTGDTSVA